MWIMIYVINISFPTVNKNNKEKQMQIYILSWNIFTHNDIHKM